MRCRRARAAELTLAASATERLILWIPVAMQAAFFFAFGASVGSFVNVVAGRWPRGQDFVSPPSRCETCGRTLSWFENVPIVSWIALRGRCRTCGVRIGSRHVWVELFAALLFGATVVLLYGGPFTAQPSPEANWWLRLGAWSSAPALLAVLTLWGCLLAASLIDAETGFIPLGITSLALGVALACMTVQGMLVPPEQSPGTFAWPTGRLAPAWSGAALGALLGTALSAALLAWGRLPRSFASIDPIAEVTPGVARREMGKEIVFLALPVALAVAGARLLATTDLPMAVSALASSALGMVVGGGTIWLTRILGTLGFGREAMGLGDVHLMAAAGAVIGWRDALLAYLLAPFIALAWVAVSGGLARFRGKPAREMPYGPHLALACVLVFLGRPWVVPAARLIFGLG